MAKYNGKIKEQGRVILIDPNPKDNALIPNEDLFIYVSFSAEKRDRSIIVKPDKNIKELGTIKSNKGSSVDFISSSKQNGQQFLTTDWSNMSGKGGKGVDEAFGIESIRIKITASIVPQVDIEFKDARAAALFDAIEKDRHSSKYDVFFSMPYPIFRLRVKGYYGRDATLPLHLTKWNSSFDETTGSFKISAHFIGMTFAFLADLQIGYIMAINETPKGKGYLEGVYTSMGYKKTNPIFGLTLKQLELEIGKIKPRMEALQKTVAKKTGYDDTSNKLQTIKTISKLVGSRTAKGNSTNLSGVEIPKLTNQLAIRDVIFFEDKKENTDIIKKINAAIDDASSDLNLPLITTEKMSVDPSGTYYEEANIGDEIYYYLRDTAGTGTSTKGYETISSSLYKNHDNKKIRTDKYSEDATYDNDELEWVNEGAGGYILSTYTSDYFLDEYKKKLGKLDTDSGISYGCLRTDKSFVTLRKKLAELSKDTDKKLKSQEKNIEARVNEQFRKSGGIQFTVRDVIDVVCANMEAFLLYLYNVSVDAEKKSAARATAIDVPISQTDIPENHTIYPFPDVFEKKPVKNNKGKDSIKYESVYLGTKVKNEAPFPELKMVEEIIRGITTQAFKDAEAQTIENLSEDSAVNVSDPQPVSTREKEGAYAGLNATQGGNTIYNHFIENMWKTLVERISVAYALSNYKKFDAKGDAWNVIAKINGSPKFTSVVKKVIKDANAEDILKDIMAQDDAIIKPNPSDPDLLQIKVSDLTILESDFNNLSIDIEKDGDDDLNITERNPVSNIKFDYKVAAKKETGDDPTEGCLPIKNFSYDSLLVENKKKVVREGMFTPTDSLYPNAQYENAYEFLLMNVASKENWSDNFNDLKSGIIVLPKAFVLKIGSLVWKYDGGAGFIGTKFDSLVTTSISTTARNQFKKYFKTWAQNFDKEFESRFQNNNKEALEQWKVKISTTKWNQFFKATVQIAVHDPETMIAGNNTNTLFIEKKTLKQQISGFISVLNDNDNINTHDVKTKITKASKNDSLSDDDDIKLGIYEHLKNLYDKWVGGSDSGSSAGGRVFNLGNKDRKHLNQYFFFVDRMWREIGDDAVFNVNKFRSLTKTKKSNMLNFINDLMRDSGFVSQLLPYFPDLTSQGAKDMFVPHTNLSDDFEGPAYLCVYAKDESKVLNIFGKDETMNRTISYSSDGFDFNHDADREFLSASNNDLKNMVAFRVAFGQQNQSIFKGFTMTQAQFSETEESLRAMSDLVDRTNPNSEQGRVFKGGDLFAMHRVRGYESKITAMGNMMIMPMMYYNLDNVPLFYGAYYITNVDHMITPNNMVTTFTGVRQRTYSAPIPRDLTTYMKLDHKKSKSDKKEYPIPEFIETKTNRLIGAPGLTATVGTETYNMIGEMDIYEIESKFRGGAMRDKDSIDTIVLHWSDGYTPEDAHNTLHRKGLSYNLFVTREGHVYQGMSLLQTAWHAGSEVGNSWDPLGQQNINSRSIGISFMFTPKDWFRGETVDHSTDVSKYWLKQHLNSPAGSNNGKGGDYTNTFKDLIYLLKKEFTNIKYVTSHFEVNPHSKFDIVYYPFSALLNPAFKNDIGKVTIGKKLDDEIVFWHPKEKSEVTGNADRNWKKYKSQRDDVYRKYIETNYWEKFHADHNESTKDKGDGKKKAMVIFCGQPKKGEPKANGGIGYGKEYVKGKFLDHFGQDAILDNIIFADYTEPLTKIIKNHSNKNITRVVGWSAGATKVWPYVHEGGWEFIGLIDPTTSDGNADIYNRYNVESNLVIWLAPDNWGSIKSVQKAQQKLIDTYVNVETDLDPNFTNKNGTGHLVMLTAFFEAYRDQFTQFG